MTAASPLNKGLLSVRELLADGDLAIPEYQRPYKWTGKHINQLFSDIALHKDKGAYRLGTVVFHQHKGKRNIVDGQQRTISLMLGVLALVNERLPARAGENSIKWPDLRKQLNELYACLLNFNPRFDSAISQANIHNNYLAVSRIVSRPDFTEEMVDFLLNKCELVYFELDNISEAFQFFDSQNARGRDLEPHDLLKAFHLREFSAEDEPRKAEVVSHWESCETDELAKLFSRYLFRIRNWSRGASARYFGKEHTHLFKGVNIDRIHHFPYVEQLRMAHQFVDDYNKYDRQLEFPFNLNQIIINGRRFFEMVAHYQSKIGQFQGNNLLPLEGFSSRIMITLRKYEGKHRMGDRYVRSLFDCVMIAYIDKFGMVEIPRAIEKAFIWAYSLRLKMKAVQLATMDNYVLDKNMFLLIKEATRPVDFLGVDLSVLQASNATKVEDIEKLFREMRYCE
ncbi:MAG: DUF262 domain-containing protein [Pseudomonadota bacterium]